MAPPPGSLGDVPGQAVLTPEATPASDIAGVVLRQHDTVLWEAGQLDGVTQLHGVGQLDDGNVVPGVQSSSLASVWKVVLGVGPWWPEIPHKDLLAAD